MHLVLLWVSCGLRSGKRGVGEAGWPELINLGALEGQHVPEHPVDGVEQLAHDGRQGLRVAPTTRLAGPLRSQDRPWIGRSDRDVARVRGALT